MAIERAPAIEQIAFIEAKYYRRNMKRRASPIWLIVHATHGAEGVGKARNGAIELATLPDNAPKALQRSTHLWIDTRTVVQSVPFNREAWHAGHTGNMFGEGIELCGSADQTEAQWLDDLSLPMLNLLAHILRWRSEQLMIPLIFRGADALKARVPGVTTHAEITKAFPTETNHFDPGPHFPMEQVLTAARV